MRDLRDSERIYEDTREAKRLAWYEGYLAAMDRDGQSNPYEGRQS